MAERWGRWLILLLLALGAGCPGPVAPPASTPGPATDGPPKAVTARAPFPPQPPPTTPRSVASSPFRFQDVAAEAGISFRHHSPLTEQRHTHLTYGSGVGWFDFDRDGWPDLYCGQGTTYRAGTPEVNCSSDPDPSDVLFLNRQDGSFVEVTEEADLVEAVYSMGVAAADYDNDGFADLCVTGYEENILVHNNGDGTFSKQTLPQGKSPGRLSASCAWADVDADGNLDLYVTNYARLRREDYPLCTHTEDGKTMSIDCHPRLLQALPDTLYRNCGDGRFEDISIKAGLTAESARCGLGVVAADLDEDGDVDLYVCNDTTPNFLWENQGDGTLVDRGVVSGTAFNRSGVCEAGMSGEAADFDGDGRFDLFVTNFFHETNTFYRNEGKLLFSDVTAETGLGAPSKLRLGFGTVGLDFDRDTFLDLLVANGHVHDRLHEIGRDEPFAQLPLLFHNEQGRRFRDVSAGSGGYFAEPHVGRGAAAADFDRDGDADLAVNHLNGPAALLRNETTPAGGWLQIELVGTASNRGGVGAVLTIDLGRQRLVRTRQAGVGYCSCGEERLLIGVGDARRVQRVSVRWPGGRRESWADLPVNAFVQLVEGTGQSSPLVPREGEPNAVGGRNPRAQTYGIQFSRS